MIHFGSSEHRQNKRDTQSRYIDEKMQVFYLDGYSEYTIITRSNNLINRINRVFREHGLGIYRGGAVIDSISELAKDYRRSFKIADVCI